MPAAVVIGFFIEGPGKTNSEAFGMELSNFTACGESGISCSFLAFILLEGSVQRLGKTIRINAQLIDAIGGHHLWAERYDGEVDNVFSLQDRIIGERLLQLWL